MTEMIERVARALFYRFQFDPEYEYEDAPEKERDLYRGCALTAIEAMREPTEEMATAGYSGSGEDSFGVALGTWRAMIDAALAETPSED